MDDVNLHRNQIMLQLTLILSKDGWRKYHPKLANFTRVVPRKDRVVAAALGHAGAEVTYKTYLHSFSSQ